MVWKELGCAKKTSSLIWSYSFQDMTSEDWESYCVCNGELESVYINDSALIACCFDLCVYKVQ
jgi:hypothetical protein